MPQSKAVLHKVRFGRDRNNKVNPYYLSMKDDLQHEKQFYSGELGKSDWKPLREASERFLIHAYSHRFHISQAAHKFAELYGADPSQVEVFGDEEYNIRYGQFYLNLAIGLELLLKCILLKQGERINLGSEKTILFSTLINKYLSRIFPKLGKSTFEEIQDTLKLINLRRNNIAHCSKRSYDTYAHECRFSCITLYIYEEFFYGESSELTELLLKSVDRSKVTQGADFKPLRIRPRSLRKTDST